MYFYSFHAEFQKSDGITSSENSADFAFEKWHCYRFERRYYLNNDGVIHKMLESLYAASDESALDPEHLHGNHAESPICPVVWRSLDADRISWSVGS